VLLRRATSEALVLVLTTKKAKLGLVFLETGANQRPSQVVYDRMGSCIALADPASYNWATIFSTATWFHMTGITPAISESAARATINAVTQAKAAGLTVSIDLNFRNKLWRWDPALEPKALAQKTMRKVLPHVNLMMANEEDCNDVLGIQAGKSNADSGSLEIDRYPEVAREIVRQFPNIQKVAITLRESLSASHNNWGAMLWDAQQQETHFAPIANGEYKPYAIHNIVDRVGGGDAFAAGLIFALNTPEVGDPPTAIRFAVAASCLAHSTVGDWNYSTRSEIEKLMRGSGSGRVER
jgi:2-dehydro-3-deoxygluconokinase